LTPISARFIMDNYLDDYSSSELLKSTPSLVFLSSELIGGSKNCLGNWIKSQNWDYNTAFYYKAHNL
ncbi:MAG: hypothetical protein AABY34_04880, partial [Pseudomonadota bacterium]